MKLTHLMWIALLLPGCLESDLDATDRVSDARIHYLDSSDDRHGFINASYRIVGITPVAYDQWHVIVEYSGGCEEHDFYTWWDGLWLESYPMQASFSLIHDSKGDACEASVRDTLRLDLQGIFKNQYPEDGAIITAFNPTSNRKVQVHPYLSAITQSTRCTLKARIAENDCNQGIWGNTWILLTDSVPAFGQVWIQPVKNAPDVSLSKPRNGSYTVGLTLLFGFEYLAQDSSCRRPGAETVLPATINCLSATD